MSRTGVGKASASFAKLICKKGYNCFVKKFIKRSPNKFQHHFFNLILECTQDASASRTGNFKHVLNLCDCVTQRIFGKCFQNDDITFVYV